MPSTEALHWVLCHYLLSRLPNEALDETVEDLTGLFEFYAAKARIAPPLPAPLPAPVSVRMGTTTVRPVFPVTEED